MTSDEFANTMHDLGFVKLSSWWEYRESSVVLPGGITGAIISMTQIDHPCDAEGRREAISKATAERAQIALRLAALLPPES